VDIIKQSESINTFEFYRAYLKDSEFSSEVKDLVIEITIDKENTRTFMADDYLWRLIMSRKLYNYSREISKDDNGNFVYLIRKVEN
jgi:hypothetical protein